MENKKIKILSFFLILTLIIIMIMAYYMYKVYNEKVKVMEEVNNLNKQITNLENKIENVNKENNIIANDAINSNTSNISNNNIDNDIENDNTNNIETSENIKYEFSSADYLAAQGNPGMLKIFKLTDTEMEFEYNQGWDVIKNTIDRNIKGVAEINNKNIYEFNEIIEQYKYTMGIKFSEEMVTVYEYVDGELISQINLWR